MLVRILGNHGAFSFDKANTSFLVHLRNGKAWLIDCGYNVPAALKKYGDLDRINGVLITHKHFDHIGGLEPILFYYELVLKRPIMVVDVPLFGDRYISDILDLKVVRKEVFLCEPNYVKFERIPYALFGSREFKPYKLYKGVNLYSFAHNFHVCCPGWLYAFEEAGLVCIFTGDTTISPYIKDLCIDFLHKGLDVVLFHDFSPFSSLVHASYEIFDQFRDLFDLNFALIPVHWNGDSIVGIGIANIRDARKLMKQVLTEIIGEPVAAQIKI